jgi:hypothetical protein
METQNKTKEKVGNILGYILGAGLMLSAAAKLAHLQPVAEKFEKWGLLQWLMVIGVGEVLSAALFLFPRTAVLGTLLLSGYLGGAIMVHMSHGEPWFVPAIFMVVLWVTAALRNPELLEAAMKKPS